MTGALALLLDLAGLDAGANVAKLVAFTLVGFWFLQLFEALSWVVLVAVLIPWVDIASVYRGPDAGRGRRAARAVRADRRGVCAPGRGRRRPARTTDVLFFALFLAAARTFDLRVAATWLGMTAGLAPTLVATYAFDLGGLPGLPGIALGFLVPNADCCGSLRARESVE